MLPKNISFIDIETTGGSSTYDRIIEIGILRVEDGQLVNTFHSLIDPQTHIPKQIEILTGITSAELDGAPTFRQIKEDIIEMLDDSYFVAHNVRFDYGFMMREFKRENITFSQKHFCTVRLSRLLYPTYRHHNLDSIIERFGINCTRRHRALDDAKVLFEFYKKAHDQFPQEVFEQAVSRCLKKPSVPVQLSQSMLENLPESPGVYIFYSETGMPLYVGKSINIRERVLSHFSSDIRSVTEMNISQQVTNIETIKTAGELGALLLESRLIKKLLPLYNKRSRVKQELLAVKSKTNNDGFREVFLEQVTTILPQDLTTETEEETFLGFFRSRKQAQYHLSDIQKKYRLCNKLLGLEKTKSGCFSYRLDACKGACVGAEQPIMYNSRFTQAFFDSAIKPWPYNGAIAIEEQDLSGKKEYFVMDKWCFLGYIVVDEVEGEKKDIMEDISFDLDIYKILKSYLTKPQHAKKIRLLKNMPF